MAQVLFVLLSCVRLSGVGVVLSQTMASGASSTGEAKVHFCDMFEIAPTCLILALGGVRYAHVAACWVLQQVLLCRRCVA